MAGFDKVYYLGHEGGFMGADGLATIDLEILHGISDREWYEARYWVEGISPIPGIRAIIPEGPSHPDSLLDAFLVLAHSLFTECPVAAEVSSVVRKNGREVLDFHLDAKPPGWEVLREQARPIFAHFPVYVAELRPTKLV